MGLKPFRLERIARSTKISENAEKVLPDKVRQHEPVMQRGSPAHGRALLRLAPKPSDDRAQQQLLREAHARVRRHFKRAKFDEPKTSRRTIGRVQLVDADFRAMRVAAHIDKKIAIEPVNEPEWEAGHVWARRVRQRDFQLIERFMPRLINARRLTRGTDEQAGEHVRKRWVALPIQDDALQQIRRRRKGEFIGSAPPSTTWLPPPVPVCRPSVMNLSVPNRH